MRKYLVEFIGTFFLVFTICFSGGNFLAPIGIGAVLMVMVYMGGHISGAHYNPSVTLAILLRGKIGVKDSLIYMLIQFIAAFCAALIFFLVWGKSIGGPKPNPDINILKPLACEIIFSFALSLVVLSVATSKKTEGNHYYGLAIGSTVLAGAITVGDISGGAFNPAVGTGPILVDTFFGTCPCHPIQHLWLYLVGPFVGGATASLAYRIINPDEFAS
ncbi:MAG: aquaporin [Bacteroidetes bacterium]|nr:aquaporin [Bacteroidota bacterium]